MADQHDWDCWIGVLRANNPADPQQIDPYSDTANEILARVVATPSRQRPSRRRVMLAAAIAALVAAVATAAILLTRDVTNLTVVCYQDVSLASDRVGLGTDGLPTAEACEQAWSDGALTIEGQTPGHIPPLTACVTERGVLAVFPTDDPQTCERLGLATPTPNQPSNELDAIAEAEEDISEYLTSASCQPLDEAETIFRSALDNHGLTDWSVQRQPDYPGRPCASVAYDIEDKTILLVPMSDN